MELLWLPLGAGGRSVRLNGRAFEAVASRIGRRPARDLYHSALRAHVDGEVFAIEMTPIPRGASDRGVALEGAVGSRAAAFLRIFRYEVRCWRGGVIPDAVWAVESPVTISDDPAVARRIVKLVPSLPRATWGRDELRTGEMWNSNSVIAWLLARAGVDPGTVPMPAGGRAPGWRAGIAAAGRVVEAPR